MKISTKLQLILPLITAAHVLPAASLPKRTPEHILLVATAKGAEACRKITKEDNKKCTGETICKLSEAVKSQETQFEDVKNLDIKILEGLTSEEKEIAIMGFVTLLMLPKTGVSLKGAVDAAGLFVKMPNTPEYFKSFFETVKVIRNAERANEIFSKLESARSTLPKELITKLEAIEKIYGFEDDNKKLSAIKALLRNNKSYGA